jgi:hypothetical protein
VTILKLIGKKIMPRSTARRGREPTKKITNESSLEDPPQPPPQPIVDVPMIENEMRLNDHAKTVNNEEEELSKKDAKKNKENEKVPRPPNSFMIFRSKQHMKIRREQPKLPNTEISRIIGQMWYQLSYEEKKIYGSFVLSESENGRCPSLQQPTV